MDIQRKAFEESNNVNPDWSFKFDEELQQYVATDFEMTNQVDEFNEHWDTFRAGWDAKAQAVPEWISVEDKEPDCGETVLICWADSPEVEPEKDYMDIDIDTGAPYWSNYNDGDEPSHWMPLPKVIELQEPAND